MTSRLVWICTLLFCGFAALVVPQMAFAQEAVEGAPATSADSADANLPAKLSQPAIDLEELELRLVPLTKAELKALTEEWLQIVKSKTEEVMEAQVTVANAEGATEAAMRKKLTAFHAERNKLFDKYSAVIDAWEKKGGDAAAIAEYRAYRSAISLEETRKADFKTLLARALAWLTAEDGGIKLAKDIAIVLVAFIGLVIVARLVRSFVRRWIGHVPNLSSLLQAFIIGIVYWLVLAFGLMIVLSALGVDITPLFALIGGASIIAAFAMQDTLSNLASGLLIMIYRPFDEGDYVDTGGVAGTVKSVNIVATTVVTPDNKVIVIPNKNVWGNIITNVTASDTRRVDLVFGISYDDPIPQAMHILEQAVSAHPLVLKEPEPTIRVNELADSSVNIICRPWVKTEDYWTVYWDLMRYVKELFDAAGISIPYPQQDVHYIESTPAPKTAKATEPGSKKRPPSGSVSIAKGDDDIA
ncbi:MAG: mechanosensitive ion channel family protein [Alphaproteobacteria bacterium]